MQYEINYLVLQSKTGQLDQIRQEIKQLIEGETASVTGEKNYLKRKLAYEIKHENYGFYTVLRFDLDNPEGLAVIKRELNLNPNVCRYIIVKASELPPLEQTTAAVEETAEVAEAPAKNEKATKAKDVLDELISQPKPEAKAPTQETVKTEAPSAKETVSSEKSAAPSTAAPAEETKEEPKKEEAKVEKKEDVKDDKKAADKESGKEDDKASLEELDKKLDEILNL